MREEELRQQSGASTSNKLSLMIISVTYHSVEDGDGLYSRVVNIDIDVDIIDDTFDASISISTILSYKSIDRGIDDTLLAFFYRHYIDTSQLTCKMMYITF